MDTTRKHSVSRYYDSPLDRPEKLIAVYRGWDAFERGQGFDPIIDFDLTDVNDTAHFNSRDEVLSALEALHDKLDEGSHEGDFLRAKVEGSIFYLRALMGERIPFGLYVEKTLGIVPLRFSEDEIRDIRSKANTLLAGFGLELEPTCRKEFEERFLIHDPDIIKRGIVDEKEFWIEQLRKKKIPCPASINVRVEFAEVDAYWSNWLSGSYRDGFVLRINLHPRKKYDLGKPLVLCLHEICGHAVQMSIWGDLISKGSISPACGITTVHSPEAYIAEGLGQTVPDFIAEEEEFSTEFNLSRWLHFYALVVLHNAHLMIYDGVSPKEILKYASKNLPFWSIEDLNVEIRDRSANPLNRSYQLSYAAAEHKIRSLTRHWNNEQKVRFFLEVYTRPMTPKQLDAFASRL